MSTDTRQQIRELAEFHQANRRPVELHEVQGTVSRATKSGPRTLLGPAVAAAVMAAILLVTGGLALLVSMTEETPPADTITPTTLVVPTTVSPTPSTTPAEDASLGTSTLVWQRFETDQIPVEPGVGAVGGTVLDGGERFVLLSGTEALTAVATSSDGVSWFTRQLDEAVELGHTAAAWDDTVLVASGGGGWSNEEDGPVFSSPSVVSVISPDGSVQRQVFDGDVLSAAVGPAGMFVTLQPHGSYGVVIDQILGSEFSRTLYQAEVRNGVLFVTREPDGATAEIVLSEHGLDEEDLNSPVAGWYSEDGGIWAPAPDAPAGVNVVATFDGFVGVTGTTAWYSEDGLAWDPLGDLPFTPNPGQFSQAPMRWRQGAVATDLSHYAYISAAGIEPLPDPPLGISSLQQSPLPLYLSGDLGVVVVNPVEGELLFTGDGENWVVGALPDEMTDSFGWYTSSGAVTSEAVLLLLWEEESPGGAQRPVWWLGTFPEE